MRKKILLICSLIFVFFIGLFSVSAKELICEYNTYELEFKVSGKNVEFLQAYEDGKLIEATLEGNIKPTKYSECPDKIYVTKDENDQVIIDKAENKKYDKFSLIIESNKVYCGRDVEGRITGIPKKIPELTSTVVTIVQIAIPVILVLLGSIDLFKGITAGKEDEMKKGQQIFIKRLIVAAVIFFVVIIVKFFISVVADTNQTNIVDCIDCFISNDCEKEYRK